MNIAFVFPPSWAPWAPSYGVALLGATCRRAGHAFTGFDLNIDFYRAVGEDLRATWRDDGAPSWMNQEFVNKLFVEHSRFLDSYASAVLAPKPDLVAISVQSASTLFALEFARLVRERRPDVFVLFGGPDCFPSERGTTVLDAPWVSAICTGEGDEVLPQYLEQLSRNDMRPVEMRGFSHRRPDGSLFDGGQPDPVLDLDSLPFADFLDIDFSRYVMNNRICMMSSRGCILRCAYCSEGANFLRYRHRSADSLTREVEQHVTMLRQLSGKRPHINFSDSLINGRPEVLRAFCELVLERKLDFSWGGMALLRKEMTPDLLALMRRAGWVEVMWGLESGSAGTLALMRKRLFTPELAERVIRQTAELGVEQYANIIVGFPGETPEQFEETVEFVKRTGRYFTSIGLPIMEIRRNSFVYAQPERFGVSDRDNGVGWRTVDGSNTIEVRVSRREVLANIISEKLFDQGRYNDLKT